MEDDGSPLNNFGKGLKKLFGKNRRGSGEDLTEQEIMSMVNEGHEHGVLQESEAEMINNIFTLDQKEAKDIMIHRKQIMALDGHETLQEALVQIRDMAYSRYPVYLDDIDNIVGIIHIKDILNQMQEPSVLEKQLTTIDNLIRPAPFIPETRNIDVLFKNMQSQKIHMVIVVDEYGQTAGIVTMEDLIEEIVGDIFDEYDESRDTFRTQVDNSIIIDGLASLDDVEQELDIEFGDVEMETLNGYLTELLGHIPSREDLDKEIVANGYRFKILSLGNRTIGRVRAEKINDKETKGESEKCQDIQNSQT